MKKGVMQRWAVEWGAGGQLNRQGVTRETLKPGDHVIIAATRAATPKITGCGCEPSPVRPTAGSGAVRSTEQLLSGQPPAPALMPEPGGSRFARPTSLRFIPQTI